MASGGELIGLGMPAALAQAIGTLGINTAVVAAGNNSQVNATPLASDVNIISSSGSTTNSVILPSAVGNGPVLIAVASGQTTVNVFPASGQTFIDEGAQTSANAAVTLAATKNALFVPHSNTWFVVRGA